LSYLSIPNLYRPEGQDILLFREAFALEKVHGTSAHLSWRNGKLTFSSGGASHERFRALFDEPGLTAKLTEKIGLADGTVAIYGEAHGGKLLGMSKTYGMELRFVAFEARINDCWLSVPQAHDFTESLGLQFVHYEKIPATLEAINAQRDAPSVQAVRNGMEPGHIREGIVLRPLIEVMKNNGQRIICKHKRDEFRETQETRSVEVDPAKLQVLQEAEKIADEWVTAMRLEHVLDKIQTPLSVKTTKTVIDAMLEDVLREGSGEFQDSPEARKAIGKKTAEMFHGWLKCPTTTV